MGARIVASNETFAVYSARCYSVGEGTLLSWKEIPLLRGGRGGSRQAMVPHCPAALLPGKLSVGFRFLPPPRFPCAPIEAEG